MHFCSNKKLIAEDKSVKRKKSSPHTAEISKGYCGNFTSLTKHV
jgi:hypothetical protein